MMRGSSVVKLRPKRTFEWAGKWFGGRVRVRRNGRRVWVIERMVNGHPYTKSLDVSNEQDALAELALFDRDPAGYQTKTAEKSRPPSVVVTVDGPRVSRFLEFLGAEEFFVARCHRSKPAAFQTREETVCNGDECSFAS